MHDIFISYARGDKPKVQKIARALEKEGFDVWWDIEIPTGKTFDSEIEKAVSNAKCVVVLWSKESVKSEWVLTEAEEGKNRNVLIPALIEEVDIPFAFRRRQTIDLSLWNDNPSTPEFKRFVKDIRMVFNFETKDRDGGTKGSNGDGTQNDVIAINRKWLLLLSVPIVLCLPAILSKENGWFLNRSLNQAREINTTSSLFVGILIFAIYIGILYMSRFKVLNLKLTWKFVIWSTLFVFINWFILYVFFFMSFLSPSISDSISIIIVFLPVAMYIFYMVRRKLGSDSS